MEGSSFDNVSMMELCVQACALHIFIRKTSEILSYLHVCSITSLTFYILANICKTFFLSVLLTFTTNTICALDCMETYHVLVLMDSASLSTTCANGLTLKNHLFVRFKRITLQAS
ncbi:unnamed protein product [Heterobilharzia americana]|nr:unnamed protein product [Heterobilharzia americana]